MKPFELFPNVGEKRFEEYTNRFTVGEMDVYKNGKAYIKLFDDGISTDESFVPTIELFLEKAKDDKTKVCLVYRSGNVFNGYFVEGEKSQFSVRELGGFNRLGILETTSVKNSISEDGGKVVLKFKATYSCFVNSFVVVEIKVFDFLEEEENEELYS